MYEKALPFFEKVNYIVGLGEVYLKEGAIYLRVGRDSKASKMYDKALFFFKKARSPIGQGNVYLNKGIFSFHIISINKNCF